MNLETFREYMNLHLISLEQDSEAIEKAMDEYTNYEDDDYHMLEIEDISTNGQIIATAHLLSVLDDMMKK
jgi:vesicle coat complex subunit